MQLNKLNLPALHLLTFFGIVLMLMTTGYSHARSLMALNMFFICAYVFLTLGKRWNWSNSKLCITILSTLLIHFCLVKAKQWDKLFLIDALFLYAYYLFGLLKGDRHTLRPLIMILAFALAFSLLHWLAIGGLELKKNALNIWHGAFLAIGVWSLAKQDRRFLEQHFTKLVVALLLLYTLSQSIGIIEKLNAFGTTRNPHYLALYSAFAFCISLYFAMTRRTLLRWVMIANAIVLGYFILITSSRPVWIAIIFSSVFLFVFSTKKQRIVFLGLILLSQAILFSSNTANYRSRFQDLTTNILQEERVPIWQNAVKLQSMSSAKEWIVGHGIDRFRPLFAQHSTYNSETKFHSPHNLFLDVLFTFGILGLVLVGILYYLLYKYGFAIQKVSPSLRGFSCLLLTILTINLLFNAINMPFFSKFNIFQIALVSGIIFYIFTQKPKSMRRN